MKSYLLTIVFVGIALSSFSQPKSDIGLYGGATFYLGEINPEKIFYNPGYTFGALYRYNFNPRYSLRVKAAYAHMSGSDSDFDKVVIGRNPSSFSTGLINLASQVEFNFIPYLTGDINYNWTPYVFGGAGYSLILSSSATTNVSASNHLVIPFGAGAKINITSRLSGGVEWTFNKTFTDRIDGVIPPTGTSTLSKNDWYNFAGLFITYKFFKFAADCPVYD